MNKEINKTCCFTGHRKISSEKYQQIFNKTLQVTEGLIKKGFLYFLTGGALGFDTIAALVVLKLKEYYPHVKLFLILPCTSQTNGWSEKNIAIYEKIKLSADGFIYTSENYTRGCMQKRNRYLVDNSSFCICYLTENRGGTFYTREYAKNKNIEILNISSDLC
ncbi:MAG: DUF1273 family protein [Oscillospiraceae bacterium]|nr:DUF1273 family protein [Oscillospiraceae bacterium]